MSKISRLLARPLATLLAIAMTMTGMPNVAYAATPDDGVAYVDESADAADSDAAVVTDIEADDVDVVTGDVDAVAEDMTSDADVSESIPEGDAGITSEEAVPTGEEDDGVDLDGNVATYDVTFTGNDNTVIRYTTDGSTPSGESTELTDSKISVDSGATLKFTVTPDKGYDIVKSVKRGDGEVTADTNGVYTIDAVNEETAVVVSTGNLPLSDVELTENSDLAESGMEPVEGSVITDTDSKKYVNPKSDFVFTLAAKDTGKTVSDVKYTIGTGEEKEALFTADGYVIPKEDIRAAIVDGVKITVDASVSSATRKITIDYTDALYVPLYYTEYSVIYEGMTPKYTEVKNKTLIETLTGSDGEPKTTDIEVGANNVIALNINTYDWYITTDDSVKVGTKIISPADGKTAPIAEGDYLITKADSGTVFVAAYEPQTVSANNISGVVKAVSGNRIVDKEISSAVDILSGLNPPDEFRPRKYTDGNEIRFKLLPGKHAVDGDIIFATPEVEATTVEYDVETVTATRTKAYSIPVTQDSEDPNTYSIAKSDVVAAIKNGKEITINVKGEAAQRKAVTVSSNKLVTSYRIYKGPTDYKGTEVDSSDFSDEGEVNSYALVMDSDVSDISIGRINTEDSAIDFVRIMENNAEISSDMYGRYTIAVPEGGVNAGIDVARLEADKIVLPTKDPKKVTSEVYGSINDSDSVLKTVGSKSYYKNTDIDVALRVEMRLDLMDESKGIQSTAIAGDVKYALAGGTPVAMSRSSENASNEDVQYYTIPAEALRQAVFAENPTITVTAAVRNTGSKAALLLVGNTKDGYGAYLTVNGTEKNDLEKLSAEVPLNSSVSAKLVANPGYVFTEDTDPVYISYTDMNKLQQAVAADKTIPDAQKQKELDKRILAKGKKAVLQPDGTYTLSISKMNMSYYVFAVTEADYDVEVKVNGKTAAVDETTTDKNPIKVRYNDEVTIGLQNGENIKTFSAAAYEAEYDEETGAYTKKGDALEGSAAFKGAAADITTAELSLGETSALAGKTIAVELTDKNNPEVVKSVFFTVSAPMGKVILVSGTSIIHTIGSVQKIELADNIPADSYVIDSIGMQPVKLRMQTEGDKNYLTLSTVAENTDLFNGLYYIIVNDKTNDVDEVQRIPVDFTAATISNEGLSVTAEGAANAVTLKFNKPDPLPEQYGYDGLYFLAELKTVDDTKFDKNIIQLIPATQNEATVRLSSNSDLYEMKSVTYSVNVRLVQLKSVAAARVAIANPADLDSALESITDKGVGDNSVTVPIGQVNVSTIVKEGTYATKIKLVKDADQPKKIYAGMGVQPLVDVTYPDAANNKPVDEFAKKVQKVVITDSKGNELKDYAGAVTETNNVVCIDTDSLKPGKYNAVVYALEPFGKEVTAKQSFTVLQGIEGIGVSVPAYVYKAPGKAATIKPALTYTPAKPATKAVSWSLIDGNGAEGSAILGGKIKINEKNGTVTIAKDLTIPSSGLGFKIHAVPGDYYRADDMRDNYIPVNVTSKIAAPAEIRVGDISLTDKGEYFSGQLRLKEISVYDVYGNELKDVSFKASGVSVDDEGHVCANKLGNASLTATTTDGTKKTYKVSFKVKSDTELTSEIYITSEKCLYAGFDDAEADHNDYGPERALRLDITGKQNGGLISHSVSVKGGKVIAKTVYDGSGNNYDEYVIKPNANKTEITITDKSVKPAVKKTVKVTNTKIYAGKEKTVVSAYSEYDASFAAKKSVWTVTPKKNAGKIFSKLVYDSHEDYVSAGSYNKVTYKVKAGGNALSAEAGDKVLINIEQDTENSDFKNVLHAHPLKGVVLPVEDKNGTLTIDYAFNNAYKQWDIPAGKYKLLFTPLDKDGAVIGKTATVTVTAAPAPKAKVAVKTTTFKDFGSEQTLEFKTQNNIAVNGVATTAEFGATDGKNPLLGINNNGTISQFAYMFEIDGDKLVYKGTSAPTEEEGYSKDSISGWVAYRWINLDGSADMTYVKITAKKVAPKATM